MKILSPRVFLFFLFIFFSGSSSLSASPPLLPPSQVALSDVTILVSSCDKYAELWKPFSQLLFTYWPSLNTYNSHVPIMLISNTKDFSYARLRTVKVGVDKSWSDGMIQALSVISTKYVLLMLEDYFITEPVDEREIHRLLSGMKKHHIPYIEIWQDPFFEDCPPFPLIEGTLIKGKEKVYRTSLKNALWEKDVLLSLLKSGESAWEFEIEGSTRSTLIKEPFLVIDKKAPIQDLNAAQGGWINGGAYAFLKQKDMAPSSFTLPIDEDYPFTIWLQNKYMLTRSKFMRRVVYKNLYKAWVFILSLWDPKMRLIKTDW